ncbi:hypothetical protein ACDA63_18780 [Uliginosibacterium sp. sgz301328]|uniref:hypothetical protein n=1 Tax=Uliginosibacterium sp. sgz301328 TaxID=3243764 RepID=UPI00359E19F3
MIDDADHKTSEMLPGAPKRRGRPLKGNAMTPAERKRRSREHMPECEDNYDWAKASKTALLDRLIRPHPDTATQDWFVRNILTELARRQGFTVTVTESGFSVTTKVERS